MIDATRWVIVEAWWSLGLRVDWCPSYRVNDFSLREHWQPDEDHPRTRFLYEGHHRWLVAEPSASRVSAGYTRPSVPTLSTETMVHELAHYLAATEEAKDKINFGMDAHSSDAEEAALQAQKVIDAIAGSASRIAEQALKGKR